ncbi:MAG: hypothetical protein ACUVR4_15380 [Anaerolineae bacterium]
MASNKGSHKKSASQEILAKLASVYRSHSIQRDPFGRRAALPSEVACVLAQRLPEPVHEPSTTGESSMPSAGDHLTVNKG